MKIVEEFRLGLRYALTGKHDKFVSFVSLMSSLGIALGTAALIVVLSVMGGFHQELQNRILSVASHIEASSTKAEGFDDWQAVSSAYSKHPRVVDSAPQVQHQALLLNGRSSRGVLIRGILPDKEKNVSQIENYIIDGSLNDISSDSFKLLLGKQLAQKLNVEVGDKVRVVAPQGVLSVAGFYPRMRQMEVGAIFSAGLYQFDLGIAYMHIEDAKRLYNLKGPNVIRLKLDDLFAAPSVYRDLRSVSKNTYLYDWTSSHGGLFQALVFEKRMMFLVLTLIIAVAAFNIVSALVTMVRSKRGEIAIMRAFGATSGTIMRIFLFQGVIIGLFGTALGLIIGIPVAANAGAIINWVETQLGLSLFPASIYHFDQLPSIISVNDVVLVAMVAFTLTLLATLYPSWHGSRIKPAEALRYE